MEVEAFDLVKKLVEKGADVNSRTLEGLKPIENATEDIYEYLHDKMQETQPASESDHNFNNSKGDEDSVRALCKYVEYDQSKLERNFVYILHACVERDYFEIFKELIEIHSWNPNSLDIEDNTPLHIAIVNENERFCQYILDFCKPDLHVRNKNGDNVIFESLQASDKMSNMMLDFMNKHPEMVKKPSSVQYIAKKSILRETVVKEVPKQDPESIRSKAIARRRKSRMQPKQTMYFRKSHVSTTQFEHKLPTRKDLNTSNTSTSSTSTKNSDTSLLEPTTSMSPIAKDSTQNASTITTSNAKEQNDGKVAAMKALFDKMEIKNSITAQPKINNFIHRRKNLSPELKRIFEPGQNESS